MNQSLKVKDKYFNVLLSKETITKRIAELGQQINADYKGKNPIFLGILNGSFMVISDLVKHYHGNCEITFVKLSSYEGLQSTGNIKMTLGLTQDIKNRHVIIVEDIVDTGKTMHEFFKYLHQQAPASVKLCTLLVKPDALQHEVSLDYVGFEIEDKFVIGYGLDYDEYGRNLEAIYQLSTDKD